MKILVAVDGSCYGEEVLAEVSRRSWPKDSTFHVITVLEPPYRREVELPYLHQANLILNDRIQLLRKKLKRNQITCEVLEGNASSMIIQEARDCGADRIVIGSHGETGVRKTQVGSVTAAVVNSAPCSVDVVKVGECQPANSAIGGVA